MSDMVAAPKHDVIAYGHEGLHRVVLEDKAVLAELHVGPDEGAAADVAGRPEPHGLGRVDHAGT